MTKFHNLFRYSAEDLDLRRKILVVCLLPMILGLLIGIVLLSLLRQSDIETRKAYNAKCLANTQGTIVKNTAVTCLTLSAYTMDRDSQTFKIGFDRSKQEVYNNIQELIELTRDNPQEAQVVQELSILINRLLTIADQTAHMTAEHGSFPLDMIRLKLNIEETLKEILAVNTRLGSLAIERVNQSTPASIIARNVTVMFLIFIMVGSIALSLALWSYVSHALANRITQLMDMTVQAARGQPLPPKLTGSDELAQLDRFIRLMIDTVAKAHERERALITNAGDAICAVDRKGTILFANPSASRLWQCSASQLIGRLITEFVPTDQNPEIADVLGTIDETTTIRLETTGVDTDGNKLAFLASFNAEKYSNRIFCVIHDITERKQAEETIKAREQNLKAIMESLPVGMLILSHPALVIEYANPAFENMTHAPLSEMVNTPCEAYFPDSTHWLLDQPQELSKAQIASRGGTILPVEIILSHLHLRGLPKNLLVALDISDRIKLEHKRQEFVQMVSAKLQSPLNALRCTLDKLQNGSYGPLAASALSTMSRSDRELGRLVRMVSTLVDYERMETGHFELTRDVHAINTAIEQAIGTVSPLARARQILIEHDDCAATANFDRDKIVQVLINLLSNAIKFSPMKSVIRVSADTEQSRMRILVTDTGKGIAEHNQAAIFERFRQINRADAVEKGGFGLGLSICKLIVNAHGGEIGVISEPDLGSTFWFTLPIEVVTPEQNLPTPEESGRENV